MDFEFRFKLDPSPRKHICPACNRKRFVRHIDITTGEYHPDTTKGRCDAESSCGYMSAPSIGTPAFRVEFLMLQTISAKAYKLTERNYRVHIIPKSVVKEKETGAVWLADWFLDGSTLSKVGEPRCYEGDNALVETPELVAATREPSYHPLEMLEQTSPDNLTRWLLTKFPRKDVEEAVAKYNVTGINRPWGASTVFWQLDTENRVRGGKVINYNPATGSRVKEPYPRITWIHSILKAEDFNLVQVPYGLNLTKETPEAEVAIVEAEKTAIYMSIREPSKVWISVGSLSGLKPAYIEPIKERSITAYPDTGKAFLDWKSKAEELDIKVDDALEGENLPDGSDLIDYYER
jgi:hypothetical protein